MPYEIYQLDHWGMPWSHNKMVLLLNEVLGDILFQELHSHRTVGFFEMQTLYDRCLNHDNIDFYNEWFCTSILTGLTAIEMKTGEFVKFKSSAGIVCTGGAGRVYAFSTYAYSSTPD